MALLLEPVPPSLDVPIDGRVHVQEVLELVEEEGELSPRPFLHEESEDITECVDRRNVGSCLFAELPAELFAKDRSRISRRDRSCFSLS